ncbi:MAG TPA: isoprenylcysteine carboxylmethyltransferase family protein [Solirubrobacteraceae bacterium]|nr:isoprenylcysteine carboxylmethyltransferase family protein [Solirubrobacteraceae bacterium]
MSARARAAAGTLAFLLLVPGVVAGLVPYALTGWEREGHVSFLEAAAGWVLVAAGLAALLGSFARFALEGIGTPAPVAPTEHLVVTGLYRYVRNPMYLAVAALIVGQALVLGRPALLLYALAFGAAVVAFVRGYEEPALTRRFGAEYEAYRGAVPGCWPRVRPWSPRDHR